MSTANIFIISEQRRDISDQMEFTDVGVLLLDSNKRFFWSSRKTAGEKAVQLTLYR